MSRREGTSGGIYICKKRERKGERKWREEVKRREGARRGGRRKGERIANREQWNYKPTEIQEDEVSLYHETGYVKEKQ